MAPDTQQRLVALLRPLFPAGASVRFLGGTEPDAAGGELYRIRIDWANDAINLRIPRAFVDDHGDGAASGQKKLEDQLATFVSDQRGAFRSNPGPRLGPVVAWTFRA